MAAALVLVAAPAVAETRAPVVGVAMGRMEPQRPSRAYPVSFAQRQAIARAAFEKADAPALKLDVQDDKAVEVEVREKAAWFDTEGMRISARKVAYSRRF